MPAAITTYVHCTDPISLAGVVSQLRARPEVRVVEELDVDQAAVAVVVADQLDDDTSRVVRALCRGDRPRIVLVATSIDESTLVAAAEVGVGGLLRRSDATADALVRAIAPGGRRRGRGATRPAGASPRTGGAAAAAGAGATRAGVQRPQPARDRGAAAGRRGARHLRDRVPDVLQRAHREERAARPDDPAPAEEPDARGRLRHARRV